MFIKAEDYINNLNIKTTYRLLTKSTFVHATVIE